MTASGFGLLIASAAFTIASNILVRFGIDRISFGTSFGHGGENTLLTGYVKLFTQPLFIIGLTFYAAGALCWFRVIATEALSTAYPLLACITFVAVTCAGAWIFGEGVSIQKIVGLAVILFGIVIVSWG